MKKILLLGAAVLMAVSVNAQLLRSVQPSKAANLKAKSHRLVSSRALNAEEMKMTYHEMRTPGTPVMKKAPKRDNSNLEPIYNRPAGSFMMVYNLDEDGLSMFYASFYAFKPYAEYTFDGFALGSSDKTNYHWDAFYRNGSDAEGYPTYDLDMIDNVEDLTYSWGYEYGDMPIFYAEDDPDADWPQFQKGGWKMSGDYANPIRGDFVASMYVSASDYNTYFGGQCMWSSKDFSSGGRNGDHYYESLPISGMDPYNPANEAGWWTGKNAGTVTNPETGAKRVLRIDGMAQAFEKPTHPYVLNQVVIFTYPYYLKVNAPVELECKVYKLDEIPAYEEDDGVYMRESDFGELVATGRAIVTAASKTEDWGCLFFTLYGEEDGIEVEVTPTIDYPILVVFEDYNSPDKSNLVDFCLEASQDDEVDEGFGELAYLKMGINDDDGNFTGQYIWCGMNNFFTSGTMKTGLTIFLDIANPFLTFYYADDAEYTFPAEGGLMEKTIEYPSGESVTTTSIEFFSWVESADEGWMLSTPDGQEVPDWLHITLTDGVETEGEYAGEFNNCVNAKVTADPLPEGMKGRKVVVRFGFPGAFLDYTFIQGEIGGLQGDVNGDGEVNIADVNALIDIILGGGADAETMARADVNEDLEVNIADINALIDIILGN